MSNTDRILELIRATPYKWPTARIAKELNITTNKAYASCKILQKFGLVSHKVVKIPGMHNNNYHAIWFRTVNA